MVIKFTNPFGLTSMLAFACVDLGLGGVLRLAIRGLYRLFHIIVIGKMEQ